MALTLGSALTSGRAETIALEHPEVEEGYAQARTELERHGRNAEAGALDAEALGGALKQAMHKALDIALDDILAHAWSGWHDLRRYADPEQTPPEDINIVAVSDHSIESEHKPSVDMVVNDITVHSFEFTASVQLEVESVRLEVQGGAITAIRLGSLSLGGSVKLGDRDLLSKEIAQVEVPGEMRLAKPFPILRND